MNKLIVVAVIGVTAISSGCASIVRGTTQQTVINTSPQGARCVLTRNGEIIATIDPTPGTAIIERSKDDIQIECSKDGYGRGLYTLASEAEGMTAGNILFGGVIGLGVDAATGAMNRYDENVIIPLSPRTPSES